MKMLVVVRLTFVAVFLLVVSACTSTDPTYYGGPHGTWHHYEHHPYYYAAYGNDNRPSEYNPHEGETSLGEEIGPNGMPKNLGRWEMKVFGIGAAAAAVLVAPEIFGEAGAAGEVAEVGTATEASELAASRAVAGARSTAIVEDSALASEATAEARVVAELDAEEAAIGGRRIYAIGKHEDTARVAGWWNRGYRRLDIPLESWSIARNDAFIEEIIESRSPVFVASPTTRAYTLSPASGRISTFGRELHQLESADYRWSRTGDFLLPPTN